MVILPSLDGRSWTKRLSLAFVLSACAVLGFHVLGAAHGVSGGEPDDFIFSDGFDLRPHGCPTGHEDADGDGLLDEACVDPFVPPDPATVATPIDPTVITDFSAINAFVYDGTSPVQRGVEAGTIHPYRLAVLRGRVFDGEGQPLAGVLVRVLDRPESGYTYTRADGYYDLAVNGGGEVTVDFRKAGFLRAQRSVATPWQDWVLVPDAALVSLDPVVTAVAFNATTDLQVHRSSVVGDADGQRQATLLFPAGVRGEMVAMDGTRIPISSLAVRATEYTVGSNGPSRMPAELPATSGYTYAVELSGDEALQAGAKSVEFDRPVSLYFENYLGFPVGARVPVGYYDFRLGSWLPSPDGRIVKILADAGGLAVLDVEGNGQPADAAALEALGIDEAERAKLLDLYPVGQELWRSAATHFTPWDCNFPYGPPPDAEPPRPPAEPAGEPDPPSDPTDPQDPDGPEDENPNEPEDPDPCETTGSIIDCSNADLGESIPIAGTDLTLNYRSNRLPGANPQRFRVRVNVTGASIPDAVKKIYVKLTLGGYREEFELDPPVPDYYHEFDWNGLDAYGRLWQGEVLVKLEVGYVYDAVYYASSDAFERSFGSLSGSYLSRNRENLEIAVWSKWTALGAVAGRPIRLNFWNAQGLGLGGWTVDGHDVLDPKGHVLHGGDGSTRRLGTGASEALVVAEPYGDMPDGEDEIVATGPDGTVYKILTPFQKNPRQRLTMQRPGESSPQVLAYSCPPAKGSPDYCGVDPWSEDVNWRTAKRILVDALDRIVLIAEDGVHRLSAPSYVVEDLYEPAGCWIEGGGHFFQGRVLLACGSSILAVWPDGQVTPLAGEMPVGTPSAAGKTATSPVGDFGSVSQLTAAANGDLYFVDASGPRIRKLASNGIVTTVAGSDSPGFTPDGSVAAGSPIDYPSAIRVMSDGRILFAEYGRIREIRQTGQLRTLLGGGDETIVDGQNIGKRITVFPTWIDQLPDGSVLFDVDGRIYRIGPAGRFRFGAIDGNRLVPSPDGRQVGEFDTQGRHVRTLDATTGATLRQFEYGASGHLAGIVDRAGNRTGIEWNGPRATAIVSPYGVRTELEIDSEGLLRSVTNAESEQWKMDYHSAHAGLLTRFERPGGATHASVFDWDLHGRLRKDTDSEGGYTQLQLATWAYQGTGLGQARTALERGREVEFQASPNGDAVWLRVAADGSRLTRLLRRDGVELSQSSAGVWSTVRHSPDPRFGLDAAYPATQAIQIDHGPVVNTRTERLVSLSGSEPGLGRFDLTEQTTVNQRIYTSNYDAQARTWTFATPEQRTGHLILDALGRPSRLESPGVPATTYRYDDRGRLWQVTWGEGDGTRQWTFGYDANGYLATLTDPLDRTSALARDSVGRVLSQQLPGDRSVGFGYDAEGNVTSISPPDRPAHGFRYDSLGQGVGYDPPPVSGGGGSNYTWNLDRQSTGGSDADGREVSVGYDATRTEPQTLTTPEGTRTYGYVSQGGGRLESVTPSAASAEVATRLDWAGPLVSSLAWSGDMEASVGFEYDPNLWLRKISVQSGDPGAQPVDTTYDYDQDGLLIEAALDGVGLALAREPATGRLSGSAIGVVSDVRTYSPFGEPENHATSAGPTSVVAFEYERDKLGRIVHKVETTPEGTRETEYGYDVAGRLETIRRDGSLATTYVYDANGNRLEEIAPGGTKSGSYDDQDRLHSWGDETFEWNASGQLVSRTGPEGATGYAYDVLGNLRSATLPNGGTVEYRIDGFDRRVGRKENGVLIRQYLYKDALEPVAELDGAGNLIATYAYAEWAHSPSLMRKDGRTYRIVTDHLGSPRRVIDVETGAVAQAMEYDEWGNVLWDTNPGFQPFGFAGGLYDPATKLIRFGARDYDPRTGRWVAKDPIKFDIKQTNLYVYALDNPISYADRDGRTPWVAIIGGGAAAGAIGQVIGTCLGGCSWGEASNAAVSGAATGVAVASAWMWEGGMAAMWGAASLVEFLFNFNNAAIDAGGFPPNNGIGSPNLEPYDPGEDLSPEACD